jgi:hypothetical protein
MSSTTVNKVPYFVLNLSGGRAKALFTVPTQMAESLVVNPVLCRGSSFDLEIDVVSQGRKKSSSTTSFLSTEFYSPEPEQTAQAISERLAVRLGSPSPVLSQFFGIRWRFVPVDYCALMMDGWMDGFEGTAQKKQGNVSVISLWRKGTIATVDLFWSLVRMAHPSRTYPTETNVHFHFLVVHFVGVWNLYYSSSF